MISILICLLREKQFLGIWIASGKSAIEILIKFSISIHAQTTTKKHRKIEASTTTTLLGARCSSTKVEWNYVDQNNVKCKCSTHTTVLCLSNFKEHLHKIETYRRELFTFSHQLLLLFLETLKFTSRISLKNLHNWVWTISALCAQQTISVHVKNKCAETILKNLVQSRLYGM